MVHHFAKLQGLGNDFVFFDGLSTPLELTSQQVALLCDRHFGIGADGVIVVTPSPRPECRAYMHYINSDGTLAQMCGNGIRCFTKFLVDRGYLPQQDSSYWADTLRGPLCISYTVDDQGCMNFASVDMDEPILDPTLIPSTIAATTIYRDTPCVIEAPLESPWGIFSFTLVSMGNPHAVTFIDDFEALPDTCFIGGEGIKKTLETLDVARIGTFFESHPAFPEKANIEFATRQGDALAMRVFERGCGETLACGTGTCATLVAAVLTQRSNRKNTVHLLGGNLVIQWNEATNHITMTGPAAQSFIGEISI